MYGLTGRIWAYLCAVFVSCACTGRADEHAWYRSDWGYRVQVSIDHQQVKTSVGDFPLLVSVTRAELRHCSTGGHVAQAGGEDLVFTSSDGITRLDHEIELYDPKEGTLVAWVRVPLLSHRSDTVLWLYYGNPKSKAQQRGRGVWGADYLLVSHFGAREETLGHSSARRCKARAENGAHREAGRFGGACALDGDDGCVRVAHSRRLDRLKVLTVEAWVKSESPRAEGLQTIVSKWSPLNTLNTFEAYDAGKTSGLDTTGFLGAVFDGRYVYFAPQHDAEERHGKVLRYDTQGGFTDAKSWVAYNAEATSGLKTKGYYGAVFDGRFVYFVPRYDGAVPHSRILRYDTRGAFTDPESWEAHDAGVAVSHQSAAFDGRYIYFSPGYRKTLSGEVLRCDTQGDFHNASSYTVYDAGSTDGLNAKCYDGAVFDGRYVYFAPLSGAAAVLRHDTEREFKSPGSWRAFDAKPLKMGRCVGAIFDGRYVYFVPYGDSSVIVRHDTRRDFRSADSWSAYDAEGTSGLYTTGYDGAAFDGRYVHFIPFMGKKDFHCNVLRYDTLGGFQDAKSWQTRDAGNTSGLKTVGYNGGAFDGRYLYFAPWHDGDAYVTERKIVGHGRVLRYDTVGRNGSFILNYAACGHNGGLCASVPGASFTVNTTRGPLTVSAHKNPEPGWHHIAGTYDGSVIRLLLDGQVIRERTGKGAIQTNKVDLMIGRIAEGAGAFNGLIDEVRVSRMARSPEWMALQYANQISPEESVRMGDEEGRPR